jgi:outer membrane protein assembly factor BamD (BamD/ComL family)
VCWTFALLAVTTVGCQAPGYSQPNSDGWDMSRLKFWDREEEDLASIDGIRGPLERLLHRHEQSGNAALIPPEGQKLLDEARVLYEAGNFEAAEKEFKSVARQYKDTLLEEDAMFYVGACHFATGRYAKAQDAYDALLKKYPAPQKLDTVTKHLFEIARTWLEFPEVVTPGEIQQVNMENPKDTPPPPAPGPSSKDPSRVVPILPNLWDRSRPLFDTNGNALQALRTIWLNDPTGPLADDALMLAASHHLRKGNYLEADRLYEILRTEYPKSPHMEDAFALGSHVKLMAHQGADYDGTALRGAGQLKESMLRIYPQYEDRERVLEEIRAIEEAKAAQQWADVEFWQRKRKPISVATCCREVIRLYPNSSYAGLAREKLAELEASGALAQSP